MCHRNCEIKDTFLGLMNAYIKKYFQAFFKSWENSFQWPARGIDCQCPGSQEHICCLQVVWRGGVGGETQVQLNSEYFSVLAELSGSASTAAELGSVGLQLSYVDSHFLIWKEHPLLHHNYYIQLSSCQTAEPSQGFNCRAWPIFMKPPLDTTTPKSAAQGLTDMWAYISSNFPEW